MSRVPRKKYPAVPDPGPTIEGVRKSVIALKQGVEVLGRLRGDGMDSAVTLNDLVDLGLITEAQAKRLLN